MKKFLFSVLAFILSFNTVSADAAQDDRKPATTTIQTAPVKNYAEPVDNLIGNYNNEVKIIFSDIDETLVPLKKDYTAPVVPKEAFEEFNKLKEANIPIILATGRGRNEIPELLEQLNFNGEYLILLQGGEILDSKGNVIYTNGISAKTSKKILSEIEKIKKENHMNSKFYISANGMQYSTEEFILPYNGKSVNVIKSLDDLGSNFVAGKFLIYEPDIAKRQIIKSRLLKKFPGYQIVLTAGGFCDITNPTCTKGNAVKEVSKMMSIDLKNAVVFGDSENDISMFDVVRQAGGIAIAVDNAMPGLKSHANYITKSVYVGGENYAIDKILKNNVVLKQKFVEKVAR